MGILTIVTKWRLKTFENKTRGRICGQVLDEREQVSSEKCSTENYRRKREWQQLIIS